VGNPRGLKNIRIIILGLCIAGATIFSTVILSKKVIQEKRLTEEVIKVTDSTEEVIMSTSERFKNMQELKSLRKQGIDPVIARYGEVDIAYPANEKEYCALGSYAVVKIVAIAEDQKELPIERAYFQLSNEKIMPLTKLGVHVGSDDFLADKVKETKDDKKRIYFENISFWTIPTGFFLDDDGFIAVDFKGERKAFKILRGPWKINNRIDEWIKKHAAGQLQVAEHVEYGLVAKFIEREFFIK